MSRQAQFGPAGALIFDHFSEWDKEVKARNLFITPASNCLVAQTGPSEVAKGAWFYKSSRGWLEPNAMGTARIYRKHNERFHEVKSREVYIPRRDRQSSRPMQEEFRPQKFSFYWAYGSNLSEKHMRIRCPDARKYGPYTMPNSQLIFRGVADVSDNKRMQVPGGLWRLTRRCEETLDRYEGINENNNGFYIKKYIKIRAGNEEHNVMYYQMNADRTQGIMPPSEKYLQIIERGYRDFELDLAYLSEALERSWSDKNVDDVLRERHNRKGRPALAKIYGG